MKKKIISIIGLGFVGLPLACVLSTIKNQNFEIIGVDKKFKNKKLNKIKILTDFQKNLIDKKMLIAVEKAKAKNNFFVTSEFKKIKNSDIVVVSTGFDFKGKKPQKTFNQLKELFLEISKNVSKNTLIILETTIPPGTSDKVILPVIKKISNDRKIKINYAYSYERVMPGLNYYDSIVNIQRCYAGLNNLSLKMCEKFLKTFINTKKFPLQKLDFIKDCEMSKILENSYRATNIAFIDEWTNYAEAVGINLNKIIKVIKERKTHSNMMRPGLGVGGYCLTKDPSFAKISSNYLYKKNLEFPITSKSLKINKHMPGNSVNFLLKNLNKKRLKILIMGATYKEDIGDLRYSPAIDLVNKLEKKGHEVHIHDPIVTKTSKKKFICGKIANFSRYEAVVFCVAHKSYKKMNFKNISKKPFYFDLNMVLPWNVKRYMKKNKYKLKVLGGE